MIASSNVALNSVWNVLRRGCMSTRVRMYSAKIFIIFLWYSQFPLNRTTRFRQITNTSSQNSRHGLICKKSQPIFTSNAHWNLTAMETVNGRLSENATVNLLISVNSWLTVPKSTFQHFSVQNSHRFDVIMSAINWHSIQKCMVTVRLRLRLWLRLWLWLWLWLRLWYSLRQKQRYFYLLWEEWV